MRSKSEWTITAGLQLQGGHLKLVKQHRLHPQSVVWKHKHVVLVCKHKQYLNEGINVLLKYKEQLRLLEYMQGPFKVSCSSIFRQGSYFKVNISCVKTTLVNKREKLRKRILRRESYFNPN